MTRWIAAVLCAAAEVCYGADLFTKHNESFPIGPNVSSIVAADLNGDGLPEIVAANRGPLANPREERPAHDQLSYLEAAGDLNYQPHPQLRSGFGPYEIEAVNVDALKELDLVVVNFMATRGRDLTLLRNVGDHIFEPHHFSVPEADLSYERMRDGDDVPIFSTPGLTSVAVRDVNGDGYRDALATGWCSDVLAYFPGVLEGYFGEATIIEAPGGPRDVAFADFNGDDTIDAVTTMYSTNEIVLWEGDGEGRFREAKRFLSRGRLPHSVAVADMNRDGLDDLIVSHAHADDTVVIFYGDGHFAFSVAQELPLGEERQAIECELRDVLVRDLDGDDRPDIAATCFRSGEVIVLRNRTDGERLPLSFQKERYTFGDGKPRVLCTEDFNGDGKPDLAVGLWETDAVALLLNRQ